MSIGEKIAQVREQSGLTVDEFSEKCGITANELTEYEKGETIPDIVVMASITNSFNLEPDFLSLSDKELQAKEESENALIFPREQSEQYEAPKMSPKKLFRKCADNTAILPYLGLWIITIVFQFIIMGIGYFTGFSANNVFFIVSRVITNCLILFVFPFLIYKTLNKQFKRAYMYFNKFDELNKYFVLFFATVYSTNLMLTAIVNYVIFALFKTMNFNINATDMETTNQLLSNGLSSVFSIIISIIICCLFFRWMFMVFYNIDGDYKSAKKHDNLKSISTAVCVFAGAYLLVSIINLFTNNSGVINIVLRLFEYISIAAMALVWILFAGAKENRSNKLVIKTAPAIIIIVFTALSFAVYTINLINK